MAFLQVDSPQWFSSCCWLHCNKKYTLIKNTAHANLGLYVSTDASINMCRANTNFTCYILMSSVITQPITLRNQWPTSRPDVAHHPSSSFFKNVYLILITCMRGEDECVHVSVCRCLKAEASHPLELSYRWLSTSCCGCWEPPLSCLCSL